MQQIESVKIATLKQHPKNPRRGDVDAIAESLMINGQIGAIVVQTSTRHVIGGNHTLKAAKKLGWKEIDVIWRDVSDDQAERDLLVLNRASDLAEYDNDALIELLRSLDDLVGTGYDDEAMRLLLDDGTPDFMPDDDVDVRLDRKSVTDCPACGHTFTPITRTMIDGEA